MAATARPPGLGDARVPCPLCGGLIHPVAGRCKHCKEDLTQFRAGRPQAAATLPALNGQPITAPATLHAPPPVAPPPSYAPPTHTGTNGQATTTAAPIAIQARDGSQPILPPRQTGSWRADQKPASSLWRSWPMIVIGVAVLAIVTAVVIMVLPQDSKKASGKKIGAPPPAPERMDVDPTNPKSSQLTPPKQDDPWADDQTTPPAPHAQPQAPMTPDPLGGVDPNDILGQLGGTTGGTVQLLAVEKVCAKLMTCSGVDTSVLGVVCDPLKNAPKPQVPANCPAAQRCFDAIDNLNCAQPSATDVTSALSGIQDCTTAMNDC